MSLKKRIKLFWFDFTHPAVLHPTYILQLKTKNKYKKLLLGFWPISRYALFNENFARKYWKRVNSVGTLDEPFVYLNFDLPRDSKILDFGCGGSSISLGLASFGYDVTGVDFRYAGFSHKNFKYYKQNFFDVEFKKDSFDCVLAISVLEHVGMGHYGEPPIKNADLKAMEKIRYVLKPDGILFISVPGGKRKIYEQDGIEYIRIFDPDYLKELCKGFMILKEIFYKKENQDWIQCSREKLSQIEYEGEDVSAILIKAQKKQQ